MTIATAMTSRVLYASLYAITLLVSLEDIAAFATTSLRYARLPSCVYQTIKSMDGKEAVEIEMQNHGNIRSVHTKNESIQQPDTTKNQIVRNTTQEESTEEAITLAANKEEEMAPTILQGLSSMQSSSVVARPMMSPFHEIIAPSKDKSASPQSGTSSRLPVATVGRKVQVVENETSVPKNKKPVEETVVSSSLYRNSVTAKIAPHVRITWEPQVAEMLLALEKVSNPTRPFMVGLVGIPGSGKSTSAEILASLMRDKDRATLVMPHDGFHIPLAKLARLPNAANIIYRRGAPDTFDPSSLAEALTRIAYGKEPTVSIPGFDHAVGDPVPNQHVFVRNEHCIVLCEGLYLLHDDNGWDRIKSFFDWTIYVEADVDACIERLKTRNTCIPVSFGFGFALMSMFSWMLDDFLNFN
jgi:uridine kinase